MTDNVALHPHRHPFQFGMGLALLAAALPLLWLPSGHDRLPARLPVWLLHWQLAAQLLTVVVAVLIFITSYRAILSPRKGAVVWLGIAFLGVGLLDLLHLFSRIDLASRFGSDVAQIGGWFSLLARLLAAMALLVYAALPAVPDVDRSRKRWAVAFVLAWVGVLGYAGLQQITPLSALYTSEGHPTDLTRLLGSLSIALNLLTLGVFWLRRKALARECLMALIFATALSAVAEGFLTFSDVAAHDSQDIRGALGATFLAAAYLYLFHATVNEALRRPLERLEMLYQRENATLHAAPDGVMWVDQLGTIVLANPAIEALSGYRPDELVGHNVSIFLPPHLRERHAQSMLDYFHAPQSRPMGLMDLKL